MIRPGRMNRGNRVCTLASSQPTRPDLPPPRAARRPALAPPIASMAPCEHALAVLVPIPLPTPTPSVLGIVRREASPSCGYTIASGGRKAPFAAVFLPRRPPLTLIYTRLTGGRPRGVALAHQVCRPGCCVRSPSPPMRRAHASTVSQRSDSGVAGSSPSGRTVYKGFILRTDSAAKLGEEGGDSAGGPLLHSTTRVTPHPHPYHDPGHEAGCARAPAARPRPPAKGAVEAAEGGGRGSERVGRFFPPAPPAAAAAPHPPAQ